MVLGELGGERSGLVIASDRPTNRTIDRDGGAAFFLCIANTLRCGRDRHITSIRAQLT